MDIKKLIENLTTEMAVDFARKIDEVIKILGSGKHTLKKDDIQQLIDNFPLKIMLKSQDLLRKKYKND